MSVVMDTEIKRWMARRKSALVLEIIQGKTTVAEASRAFDLTPAEIESWVEDGKRGMENALVNFRCADPRFAGQFSASGNTEAHCLQQRILMISLNLPEQSCYQKADL